MSRKNKNRGFEKLRVWQSAIELYVLAKKLFISQKFEDGKTVSNILDSCHSINRNIAEGYCRRNLKEYIQYLYIALGSSGELHSSAISFQKSGKLTKSEYEQFDELHFKMENQLLKLVQSLEAKLSANSWTDNMMKEPLVDYSKIGTGHD